MRDVEVALTTLAPGGAERLGRRAGQDRTRGWDIDPSRAFVRYGDEHAVDLVVIGTPLAGRGIAHALLGSTRREDLSAYAHCPVLHGTRSTCLVVARSGD
jgi:nucleotide-binding universal stress UspA family protein